jgi:hypothetical protein
MVGPETLFGQVVPVVGTAGLAKEARETVVCRDVARASSP